MTETSDAPLASRETIRALMLFAFVLTIGLTAAAFWLSYEHLHDVANGHGLSGARAWAWPATVDTFIIIGETMILVAHFLRQADAWAVFVTVVGSVGSVALNVAGVGADAAAMTYVVAAVPPCGALLAFAILMRQLKRALGGRRKDAEPATEAATEPIPADDVTADGTTLSDGESDAQSTLPDATETPGPVDEPTPPVDAPVELSDAPAVDRKAAKPSPIRRPKAARSGAGKRPPRRSLDEWVEIAGPVFHAEFQRLRRQPTASEFAQAIDRAGFGLPSETVAKTVRTEILDRADVPALAEEGR